MTAPFPTTGAVADTSSIFPERTDPDLNLLDDPARLALPHPVRVDADLGEPIEAGLFTALGLWQALKPYFGDERTTTEWILNRVPSMTEAALGTPGVGQGERGLRVGKGEPVSAALGRRRTVGQQAPDSSIWGARRSDGAVPTPPGLDAGLSRWNAETPTATQTATMRIDKSYTLHEDACIRCVCSQWGDSCVMPPSIYGRCLSSVI
ncbi:hypothetical protein [Thiococcus pfennigii]|uniref:hypothetical protein n=1 Tax=Thiococcus pfennigii TaxID=1057 RepID=UPI001903A738|nr:hypothetical protein [Thiococcus pfennigii]